MKVLVQWTQATPSDWVEVEVGRGSTSRAWRDLPSKAIPTSSAQVDNTPGYVMAVCVQGVEISGHDHIAVAPSGDGLTVWYWSDDSEDGTNPHGGVWTFRPGWVDRTFAVNGRSMRHQGPDQSLEIYNDNWTGPELIDSQGPVPVRPWSAWPTLDATTVRHGIWVPDALFDAHRSVRRAVSWREWA